MIIMSMYISKNTLHRIIINIYNVVYTHIIVFLVTDSNVSIISLMISVNVWKTIYYFISEIQLSNQKTPTNCNNFTRLGTLINQYYITLIVQFLVLAKLYECRIMNLPLTCLQFVEHWDSVQNENIVLIHTLKTKIPFL